MKKLGLVCLVCLVCLLYSNLSFSQVINVPDDFETIQGAIDASRDGDEIRVAAGRYEEILTVSDLDVDIIGNPEDPSSVVIDGAQGGIVITFAGDVRNSTILDGFTITGGEDNQRSAGGIACNQTSPRLQNLIITENTGARGGGIIVEDGDPVIHDVWIINNTSGGYGGGITLMGDASPVMSRLVIINNRSVNRGGGLASFSRGRPELHNSTIVDNNSANNGGGLFSQGNMILVDVLISGNSCDGEGGGIYANGDITGTQVVITANEASGNGGGIFMDGQRPSFERLVIAGNTTQSLGGGVFISGTPNNGSAPTFFHATFAGNIADQDGGAFYCHDGADPVIRDCILWGDAPQEVCFNEAGDANTFTATYSDIEGGEDGIAINNNGEVTWGAGAIDADPLFANPGERDFHLTWANFPENDETKSPCINTGHPDIDPDPDGTRADMGMYYFHQSYPDIAVQPHVIGFEEVEIGDTRMLSFTIGNGGDAELNVTLSLAPEEAPFRIMRQNMNLLVQPGEEEIVAISFTPPNRGEFDAEIRIESNDPRDPLEIVTLLGEGANRQPQAEEERSFTLTEDSGWTFLVDLNEMFTDPDGDELVFSVDERQYLTFDLRESSMLYVHPQLDYWADLISCRIHCNDQFGGVAENVIYLTIEPLNDLPDPFSLQTPTDEFTLFDSLAVFTWQIALQNRWEADEITYNLYFRLEDDFWEYQLEGLESNRSPGIPIFAIHDSLGIRGGCVDMEMQWWVEAYDDSGFVECRERFILYIPGEGYVGDDNKIPTTFSLFQNYPNPFNAETTICFALPVSGQVSVKAFDIAGRPVANILGGYQQAGLHKINWNARGLQAGVYMVEVVAGDARGINRVILLK